MISALQLYLLLFSLPL